MGWERVYVELAAEGNGRRAARVDVTADELLVRWNGTLHRIPLERITAVQGEEDRYGVGAERPAFVTVRYADEAGTPAELRLTCWDCAAALVDAIMTARARRLACT